MTYRPTSYHLAPRVRHPCRPGVPCSAACTTRGTISSVSTSPLVPTWALQLGLLLVLITAGVCGRAASPRHVAPGMICVLSLLTAAGLLAVLVLRMSR